MTQVFSKSSSFCISKEPRRGQAVPQQHARGAEGHLKSPKTNPPFPLAIGLPQIDKQVVHTQTPTSSIWSKLFVIVFQNIIDQYRYVEHFLFASFIVYITATENISILLLFLYSRNLQKLVRLEGGGQVRPGGKGFPWMDVLGCLSEPSKIDTKSYQSYLFRSRENRDFRP